MERYTTPYLLVSKVLHERGLSNELATVPLQAGTRVIGQAISEVVQCVPSPDYPILIAPAAVHRRHPGGAVLRRRQRARGRDPRHPRYRPDQDEGGRQPLWR